MNNKNKIRAEVERLLKEWRLHSSIEGKYRCEAYKELLEFIDSLPEEPVTEDLKEAAKKYGLNNQTTHFTADGIEHDAETPMLDFIDGAKWQKKQLIDKACEWLNLFYSEDRHCYLVSEDINEFRKAMEAEK